jgi:hypothetical protein
MPARYRSRCTDTEREQLQRDTGDHLMIGGRLGGKAQFLTEHLVVIVEDRDVAVTEIAV